MKQLSLKAIDESSIQVKGCGINKICKSYTGSKIPGAFVVSSLSNSSSIRIYCLFDNDLGWQFALSPIKACVNTIPFSYYIDYTPPTNTEGCIYVIHLPADAHVVGEGEFSD
jgi:hypothetical protein